jgi:hypothetical protein
MAVKLSPWRLSIRTGSPGAPRSAAGTRARVSPCFSTQTVVVVRPCSPSMNRPSTPVGTAWPSGTSLMAAVRLETLKASVLKMSSVGMVMAPLCLCQPGAVSGRCQLRT